uniref:Uncharacterized protein n=1 Tax=Rhizophora mucronata TaxID=61149 RepID=A0A2P2P4P1_RHIMU
MRSHSESKRVATSFQSHSEPFLLSIASFLASIMSFSSICISKLYCISSSLPSVKGDFSSICDNDFDISFSTSSDNKEGKCQGINFGNNWCPASGSNIVGLDNLHSPPFISCLPRHQN